MSRPFDGMVNATGAAMRPWPVSSTRPVRAMPPTRLAFGMGASMVAIASSDTISREMSPLRLKLW
ncbi:MAG: hypothetical protein ACLUI3_04375 [Christensenellales bacterium]